MRNLDMGQIPVALVRVQKKTFKNMILKEWVE